MKRETSARNHGEAGRESGWRSSLWKRLRRLRGDLIGLSSVTLRRAELDDSDALLVRREDFASSLVSLGPTDQAFLDQNAIFGSDDQQEQETLSTAVPNRRLGLQPVQGFREEDALPELTANVDFEPFSWKEPFPQA